MVHGLHKATPSQEALGGDGTQSQCMASKKEPQNTKPKEQPMLKSNDNTAMIVHSRLQIEQISSQTSVTVEGNWRLVLANYPMKEQENVERFTMLMSNSKSRRPPMR